MSLPRLLVAAWLAAALLVACSSSQERGPNSRALANVTGYLQDSSTSALAHLYEPSSGTWSATGSLAQPRSEHAEAILGDGRVILVGGVNETTALTVHSSAELFDPGANAGIGAFGPAPSLTVARFQLTATALRTGEALIAGGARADGTRATNAELFDPVSNTLKPVPALTTARGGQLCRSLRRIRSS
jgi:hypothetical protein